MTTLYEKAKRCLEEQYHQNYEIVKESAFHRAYVNEKIRHSLQVSGAGNGILRNEAYFQGRSAEFLDIAQTAIVLHDIFRFSEVRRWFLTGEKSDHGVEGAAMLKKMPLFNDIRITLPVKHHGHMIERFYEDEEYLAIDDPKLREDVEHIIFAVRDADKIANWQILTNEFEAMRQVWLPHPDDFSADQGVISEKIWESFEKEEVVPLQYKQTNADELISVICWLFDMNYKYAVTYCYRLNLFNKFFKLFDILGIDQKKSEQVREIVRNYVAKKFLLQI